MQPQRGGNSLPWKNTNTHTGQGNKLNTNTRENYLVGWETLEAFLKFPTRVLPLDHRTTLSALFHTDNDDDDDDDDDEFEEAGFEPSSSKNAEKDSSTGTSCFKNRLESAKFKGYGWFYNK
ncbi:hypothetical protein DPMN_153532 [Dreissena polymorpha]|uniref:Uncharacterized protein n=1 Tax=Dreissena polymorpha TaxID=45954 RepID=A0A9D4J657_DREPO|nr:hypothetical protein DPMN_153532 [Dreissena polymorpha]